MESSPKFNPAPPPVDVKEVSIRVLDRIIKALQNPLSVTEYDNLDFGNEEITENTKGIALAYNLAEFRILLEYISASDSATRDKVNLWLAHENAHINVAQTTGAEVIGYGMAFILEDNEKISYGPLAIYKRGPSWKFKEYLEKKIKISRAPLDYGESLSPSDEENIHSHQERLDRINFLEKEIQRLDIIIKGG